MLLEIPSAIPLTADSAIDDESLVAGVTTKDETVVARSCSVSALAPLYNCDMLVELLSPASLRRVPLEELEEVKKDSTSEHNWVVLAEFLLLVAYD
jgi:hypothetical protein